MNNTNTPKPRNIVPFFLLSGLLALTVGCSSTKPRPVMVKQEPVVETGNIVTSPQVAPKATPAQKIRVKASHPRKYTVKKGDTLWDISSLFLRDPWFWPEIWKQNPQVNNPHLIYPGDILTLVYVDGAPQIRVNGSRSVVTGSRNGMPVKKLSPYIRATGLRASIPSIPGDAIRQFLSKPRVITKEQLDLAPRIIASQDNHLILGEGTRVYIRGEIDKERTRFAVFHPGDKLYDPESGDLLGYEAQYSGNVRITNYDDPASADLTFTEREVLIGDSLLPEDKSKLDNLFFPHAPKKEIKGQIISLYDALFGVAQYQIVVINRGEDDGMEVGHLLATYTQGNTVRDRHPIRGTEKVKLPNERSGLVMIFKTFDRVSYAITLEAERIIHKLDYVKTPRF